MTKKKDLNVHRAAPLFLLLLILAGCSRLPVSLSPPPLVERLEGYASLSLSSPEASSRARLSFLFSLPRKVRIEGIDPLGRTLYRIVLDAESGYLSVPSKRVYWQAGPEEITAELLGFSLSAAEMAALLTGEWPGTETWDLERDGRGRVTAGDRRGVRFEVKEFFGDGTLPRLISFGDGSLSGRLKILRIEFNKPLRGSAFDLGFLKEYQPRTRDQIEALLRHED